LADEGFVLDSVLNVVDCKNFEGYADNSYTAKLQAQYTDLVLLTKHEGVRIVTPVQFADPTISNIQIASVC
jgi:G3E family GTPase